MAKKTKADKNELAVAATFIGGLLVFSVLVNLIVVGIISSFNKEDCFTRTEFMVDEDTAFVQVRSAECKG